MTIFEAYKTLQADSRETVKEIQAKFHKLAIKNHPDRGGDENIMKELVAAWDMVRKNHSEVDAKGNTEGLKTKYDVRQDLINLAVDTLNFWGYECPVDVVICGQWIWVTGDKAFFTEEFRTHLKSNKYFYMRHKQAWAYKGCKSFSRGQFTMNDIYQSYGCYDVKYHAPEQNKLSA